MTLTSQFGQPLFGLVRLYADELALLPGVRRARWLAWAVAIAAVMFMLVRDGESGVVVISIEALGWLSWLVGGAVTWSVLRNWRKFQEPLADLARERGIDKASRELSAPLALTWQLAVSVGAPALLLTVAAIALASGSALSWTYPILLFLVPAYALVFALGLSLLAFLSTKFCPEAATSALCFALLIPHACRVLWPDTPSIIGFYEWLWYQLIRLGAGA